MNIGEFLVKCLPEATKTEITELLVLLESKNINPPYLTEDSITYKVEIKLIAGSMPVYDIKVKS